MTNVQTQEVTPDEGYEPLVSLAARAMYERDGGSWDDMGCDDRTIWLEDAFAAVAVVRAEVASLLSDTFLAERDLDPKYFRRIRGRRVNRDYNAGYRMAMEDAARYARGDFTPPGKNLEESIEKNLAMLPGDDA